MKLNTPTMSTTTASANATQMKFEDSSESSAMPANPVVPAASSSTPTVPALGKMTEETKKNNNVLSPFHIHSSVLDSVFSTQLDGKDDAIDHTPMFDELDFIVDGANVNSKDEWVALFDEAALFAGSEELAAQEDASQPLLSLDAGAGAKGGLLEDSMLEALLVEPSPNGLSDETVSAATTSASSPELAASSICTSVAPSTTSSGVKRTFCKVDNSTTTTGRTQAQLFTPNPSSTLPTPQLDVKRPSLKKTKVDHLGCVTYSKKQRTQSLQPIDFTEIEDSTALKRAKNTEAARRSRARKMERMSQLEDRVGDLMAENDALQSEVERLKALLGSHGISC